MELIITWKELLIAIILASVVYLVEQFIASVGRRKKQQPNQAGTGFLDVETVTRKIVDIEQRVNDLEIKLSLALVGENTGTKNPVFEEAVNYAREGMSASEIASRCGISQDEAALIITFHQPGR